MEDGISALLDMARWLKPAFPDKEAADVERTVLEIVYAGVLTLAYYLEDEKTPDVTWDDPALDTVYPASWSWREDCLDFKAVNTSDSWITDKGQLWQVLSVITSMGVGKPGGFIAWSLKGGTWSILLPRHVIEELESEPQEQQQSLDALYKPYKLGREQGLVFSAGIVELNVYPLFVDYDAVEAFFPVHIRLRRSSTKRLNPAAKQKEFVREILFPLKDAIIDRGGFADDNSTEIVTDFHFKIAFDNEITKASFIQTMIADANAKGRIQQFSSDTVQQAMIHSQQAIREALDSRILESTEHALFVPIPADRNILQAIFESDATMIQVDIQHACGEALRTIKERLPILESAKLVNRPHGLRRGYAIMEKGRVVLKNSNAR